DARGSCLDAAMTWLAPSLDSGPQGHCLRNRKRTGRAPVVHCGIWFRLLAIGSAWAHRSTKPAEWLSRLQLPATDGFALRDLEYDLSARVAGLAQLLRLARRLPPCRNRHPSR